jgi:alkylation response protein AidB-like acyl-CoA dehydrogenase
VRLHEHDGDEEDIVDASATIKKDVLRRAVTVAARCAALAATSDYEGAFPSEEFKLIHDAGLLTASLAREQGGAGIGIDTRTTLTLLHLLKHIGRGNLAVGRVYEGHVNALQLVNAFGKKNQIERFARDVGEGKLFGVWNTEAADGVRFRRCEDGTYRLEGAKTFASGAGYVARPIITGRLPENEGGGWQMCVVQFDEADASIDASWWKPLGMRSTASFRVDFGGVRVEADNFLGAPDDYYRQPWFTAGAIRFAAVQLGAAEALFDHTRDYLRGLSRTADAHQRTRAGETAILIESGNAWLRGAAALIESSPPTGVHKGGAMGERGVEQLLAYANMTRTAIENICLECMRLCERSVGARGLLRPHPMERIHRDLTLYLRQPATDAALSDVGRYALESKTPSRDLWFDAVDTEDDPNEV